MRGCCKSWGGGHLGTHPRLSAHSFFGKEAFAIQAPSFGGEHCLQRDLLAGVGVPFSAAAAWGCCCSACLLACSWDCCGWDLLIPPLPALETGQAREDPLLTERGEITIVMIPLRVLLGAAVVILCNCVCLTL